MSYTKVKENMLEYISGEGKQLTDINQLIGFKLGYALQIATKNDYCVDNISITAPPKLDISEYDNSFRVLRVHSIGEKRLKILVCKPL